MQGYRILLAVLGLSLALGACTEAQAYLYDTFYAWPGRPNRVDDYIDSLSIVNPADTVDVIVDFCSTPTQADSFFLETYGWVYEVFGCIQAIALRDVVVSDCYLITANPRVKMVEWDESLYVHVDISARAVKARASATYPYPAQAAWDLNPPRGIRGNGITVSIIDSGVDDAHPALAGKFVAGYDAVTQTGGPGVNPDDDFLAWYHGTAVAGIVMGNDPAQQFMGVAPAANLVECKIFNSLGQSQASFAVSSMIWCINNRATYGIDVMCMPFGGRPSDGMDAMSRAADVSAGAGIVPVASAGNAPPLAGIDGPGAGDNVITVSAVTDNGTVPRADDAWDPVSQMGPRTSPPPFTFGFNDLKPEVSAHANTITTCRGVNPGQGGAGFWVHPGISGTSFATAHVAGVCALLLEKFPGTPPAQLDAHLRATAEQRGAPSFPWLDPAYNTQFGWGIVDAALGVNTLPPVDVAILAWANGNWNSKSIWAGHYPVKVGDPNTLNARIHAIGGAASGVTVTFETMAAGWGSMWVLAGAAVINIPFNGSAVATIPFTPGPQHSGHKCVRVTAAYASDPNPANNRAQENIDVLPAPGSLARRALASQTQRYVFPLLICADEETPGPFRTADACICTKDLPTGADAWIEPPLPQDLLPGQCLPCSLIVQAPEEVEFVEGNAVYVNGWFWGNTVSEAGVTVYFVSAPATDVTVAEIQYTDDPATNSPMLGQKVRVSGIVTAGEGVYPDRYAIQDGEGPWSGIFVANGEDGALPGDSVTVTGTVQEVSGLTQVGDVTDFVLNSGGNPVPAPASLTPGVVDTSEAYEGALVEVDSAVVVFSGGPGVQWQVARSDSCWVGHWAGYSYVPEVGHYLNVTGVVGYTDDQYRIEPRSDADIEELVSGNPTDRVGAPRDLALAQNRPNPFAAVTEIRYGLPKDGHVRLTVYNVSGQVVKTLINADKPAGYWRAAWDGTDSRGARVADGVYFCTVEAGGKSMTRRMVFIR